MNGISWIRTALLCGIALAPLSLSSVAEAASSSLVISGTPATTVAPGQNYSFQPVANDSRVSRLKFNISNLPPWATFNETTGLLSGRPGTHQTGTYKDIVIRLTDWYGFVTLPAFSITVTTAAATTPPPKVTPPPVAPPPVTPPPVSSSANAALDWTPPTENTNGTVLTNLAGYHVHYGTSATNLSKTVTVSNPGVTSYVVDNLSAGTWYFAISSYSTAGIESGLSAVVSSIVK
jgi:hypothetical protein